MKKLDLLNKRFTKLLVIDGPFIKNKSSRWLCKCDCGTKKEVLGSNLTSNAVKSCGCLRFEVGVRSKKYFGEPNINSLAYQSWASMKSRCLNTKHRLYKDYGGRGITICNSWLDSFENFYKDMGERPKGYTIDRLNVNGNYEPNNCEWKPKGYGQQRQRGPLKKC